MGIPYFFRYIRMRHRETLLPALPEAPDVLYVDLNCAVHRCAEVVGDTDKAIETVDEMAGADKHRMLNAAVISRVLTWIEELATSNQNTKPKKELFLALDGVPPRAKMVQQRSRRFISSLLRKQSSSSLGWDSCSVTPGTPFMMQLNKALEEARVRLMGVFECEVTISDSAQPGEGEHKIFENINSFSSRDRESTTIAVYGADADLLLLAMRCSVRRTFIVREDERALREEKGFTVVDIEALRRRVSGLVGSAQEFVTLCTFLGNDFIPALSYISARERGVDMLIEKHQQLRATLPFKFGLRTDDDLHYESLLAFVDSIAQDEGSALARLSKLHDDAQTRRRSSCSSPSSALEQEVMHRHALCNAALLQPGVPGWQHRYYTYLFRPRQQQAPELCGCYVAGIAWTFGYYNAYSENNAKLSDWHYPHAYSPTAHDLAAHLRAMGETGFGTMREQLLTTLGILTPLAIKQPLLQLMMVLPPASSALLPEHVRPIMLDATQGCVHYYPKEFLMATYLKQHASDCLAILPPINGMHLFNKLRSTVQKSNKKKHQLKSTST